MSFHELNHLEVRPLLPYIEPIVEHNRRYRRFLIDPEADEAQILDPEAEASP